MHLLLLSCSPAAATLQLLLQKMLSLACSLGALAVSRMGTKDPKTTSARAASAAMTAAAADGPTKLISITLLAHLLT